MDRGTAILLAFICLVASVGGDQSPSAAPAKAPTAAKVSTPPVAAPVATPPTKPTTPAPAAAPVATPPAVSTPPAAAPVSTPPASPPVVSTPPPAPVPVSAPPAPAASPPVQSSPPTPAPEAATPPAADAPVEAPTPSKKKGKKHAAPAPAPEMMGPPAPPSEAPGPNADAFAPGPVAVGDLLVDIAGVIRQEFDVADYEVWVLMVWKVWTIVCKVTHHEMEGFPKEVENESFALWEAYKAAKPISSAGSRLGVELGEKKWSRPPADRLRVDVDVLFHPELNLFGVGIIIRNHYGEILVAVAKPTKAYSNAMIAEMMAIVHGITVCVEHKLKPVEIYTDSILAARIMADPEEDLLPDDVRDIILSARDSLLVGVFHMYRTANMAAHRLAQSVRHDPQSFCWTDRFPSWLRDISGAEKLMSVQKVLAALAMGVAVFLF